RLARPRLAAKRARQCNGREWRLVATLDAAVPTSATRRWTAPRATWHHPRLLSTGRRGQSVCRKEGAMRRGWGLAVSVSVVGAGGRVWQRQQLEERTGLAEAGRPRPHRERQAERVREQGRAVPDGRARASRARGRDQGGPGARPRAGAPRPRGARRRLDEAGG